MWANQQANYEPITYQKQRPSFIRLCSNTKTSSNVDSCLGQAIMQYVGDIEISTTQCSSMKLYENEMRLGENFCSGTSSIPSSSLMIFYLAWHFQNQAGPSNQPALTFYLLIPVWWLPRTSAKLHNKSTNPRIISAI